MSGKVVCIDDEANDGQLWGMCNWGWALPQRVAAGTLCKDGKIVAKRDGEVLFEGAGDGDGVDYEGLDGVDVDRPRHHLQHHQHPRRRFGHRHGRRGGRQDLACLMGFEDNEKWGRDRAESLKTV